MRKPLLGVLGSATIAAGGLIPSYFNVLDLPVWLRGGIVIIAWIGSALVGYRQTYQPLMKMNRVQQEVLIRALMDLMLREYKEYTLFPGDIRANVMPVQRTSKHRWKRTLKIGSHVGAYAEGELNLEYLPGVGLCGRALAENQVIWFDRTLRHEHLVNMPVLHGEATSKIVSVLSVPIYLPTDGNKVHPVGVLNLDSTDSCEFTNFDDPKVQNLAMRASGFIGIVLQ